MLARLFAIASLLSVLLCVGCEEPEPKYQTSIVKYDPRLIGTWDVLLKGNDHATVTITPRARATHQDRLEREKFNDSQKDLPPNAITVLFAADVTKQVPADATDGERSGTEHIKIELKGLTLEIDGMTFIAFQPSAKQMGFAHLGGLVLPMHTIIKYDLVDDRCKIWTPDKLIAWLPDVHWLDAAEEVPDEPVLPETDTGIIVTNDIDRLVKVIRSQSKIEGFWKDPQEVTRAK